MSAPSESAASLAPCACTNISLMQLFHELKQKFPGVPDHVVSNTIELYCHDKQACETHLHGEVKASLTHAYHASSLAAARKNEPRFNPPGKCRNQPIVKHDAVKPTTLQSVSCETPLTAVLSTAPVKNESDSECDIKEVKIPNTDNNQNLVDPIKKEPDIRLSPVTVINIDNCFAKYSAESPSDLESTNDNPKEEKVDTSTEKNTEFGITNYAIHKSSKIRSNLNEKLEKSKQKKTIRKEDIPKEQHQEEQAEKKEPEEQEKKPTRPTTLDFVKANPEIAFKPSLKPEAEPCQTVSPAHTQKQETKEKSDGRSNQNFQNVPLNFQVNVNCHMDYSRGYDPWLDDYDSPRTITSVNLTVCTPTSNMASPVHETRKEDGFEGHVTVTVSPSAGPGPGPRRPAPAPPRPAPLEHRPARPAPEPPGSTLDRSLIERQKERLGRLAAALAQEKGRLAQLTRETDILAAPPPPVVAKQRLKEYVERLREQCDTLAKRLEMGTSAESEEQTNFYSNIYTGQRPPSSWTCHMCTFRNHPLLDKCEECDMPRILVGTSPSRTHDSGFGSFRDRNRRISSQASQTDLNDLQLIQDCPAALGLNV